MYALIFTAAFACSRNVRLHAMRTLWCDTKPLHKLQATETTLNQAQAVHATLPVLQQCSEWLCLTSSKTFYVLVVKDSRARPRAVSWLMLMGACQTHTSLYSDFQAESSHISTDVSLVTLDIFFALNLGPLPEYQGRGMELDIVIYWHFQGCRLGSHNPNCVL